MNSGLEALVQFAGSPPGLLLKVLGQGLVVVCIYFDLVRALSVPRTRRRYVANSVFMTLALPSILISMISVLIYAASGSWLQLVGGVFVLVAVTFRWRHGSDEDSWWKGKGKQLGRWLRGQAAARPRAARAAA